LVGSAIVIFVALKMKIHHILLFFTVLVMMAACEEPDCTSELSSTINLSFYKLDENEPDTVFVNKLSSIGEDSVLLEDEEDVSKVVLPADPDTSAVTFIFDTREYGVDTLTISYSNGSRLIAEDCGFELIFSDLGYIRNDFDSIRIVNTILAEQIDEDIRIYNN